MEEFEGRVAKIVFEGSDDYKIAVLSAKNGIKLNIKGKLSGISEGENIVVRGFINDNPKYGKELIVKEFSFLDEKGLSYLRKFLASGIIKGIKKGLSQRIVDKFKDKTLEIIRENPDELLKVQGIGEKNFKIIKKSLIEKRELLSSFLFLSELGLGPSLSEKIYMKFKEDTEKIVKNNPYILVEEIYGVGFKTADSIARRLGIPEDSPLRIKSFIVYLLLKTLDEGDTYLLEDELLKVVRESIGVDKETVSLYIDELAKEEKIIVKNRRIALKTVFDVESSIPDKLKIIIQFPSKTIDVKAELECIEEEEKIKLSPEQKEAVLRAFSEKFLIITGGPGTGKTTIIKVIGKILKRKGFKFYLAAPTGRASKRITEATNFYAQTIHRLLEYNPYTGSFSKNRFNPLLADFIILDEFSMVDTLLFSKFLEAVVPNARIILVGDHYQLPPVGPGYPLRDLINSGKISVIELKKIYRQKEDSLIVYNAHRIKEGKPPEIPTPSEERLFDFYFVRKSGERSVFSAIIELYTERIMEQFSVDPLSDRVQVLTPLYRGLVGVDNLNRVFQEILNRSPVELRVGERIFKLGDKVMQLKNNYEKEVFNGDIGRICSIDRELKVLTVDFYGRKVSYFPGEFSEITLSYAISVHKSQGSEYDFVVMPVVNSHSIMLKRNLIYTALTRARKLMVMVGEIEALKRAALNDSPLKRNSFLKEFLKEM